MSEQTPITLTGIALLHGDDTLAAHVRDALREHGAAIVYDAGFDQLDCTALCASGASAALINLDDGCADRIDALTSQLEQAGVAVTFNDAEISRRHEGWQRARWARHLVAKLCGSQDVDPPRPQTVSSAAVASSQVSAAEHVDAQPAAAAAASVAARPLTAHEIETLVADFPDSAQSDSTQADDATAAELSAQIDQWLADAPAPVAEVAPWEATIEPLPAVTPGAEEAAPGSQRNPAGAAPVAPIAAPAPHEWKITDDNAAVFAMPRQHAQPAAAAAPDLGSLAHLELVPLEADAPAAPREIVEMNLGKLEREAAARLAKIRAVDGGSAP